MPFHRTSNLEPSYLDLRTPLTGGHVYNRRLMALAPRHGVEIRPLTLRVRPFPLSLLAGRWVLAVVRAMQPSAVLVDSLVAHCLWPGPGAGVAPAFIGLVHQPPGGLDHGWPRRRLQQQLDLRAYRRMGALIATSQLLADTLAAGGIPRDRIAVVTPGRGGGDEKERRRRGETESEARRELRQGRRCGVLCVANWLERKGVDLLVEAVGRLPERCVTLHLVGDTCPHSRYGRRVAGLVGRPELAGRVVVHGPLSERELDELYAAADVFALPSLGEPYGMVYAEALAAGLPLVGFRSGNLPNLVRHEVEGLLVPPGDVEALAQALRRLAEDESLRMRLARAAQQVGTRLPTWEQTAERFCQVIRGLSVP